MTKTKQAVGFPDVIALQRAREALVKILRSLLGEETQELAGTYWDEEVSQVLLGIQSVLARQGFEAPCLGCIRHSGFPGAPDPLADRCGDGTTPAPWCEAARFGGLPGCPNRES